MKSLKLKKWIKNLLLGVNLLLLAFFGGLTGFELNLQSIIILLILLGLFASSGIILLIDNERKWNKLFK